MELFQKNLVFLSNHQPELFKKFEQFQPKKVFSRKSLINDIEYEGEPFYNMDGRIACQIQADHYFNFPTHFSLTYRSQPENGYLHQIVINQLNEKAKQLGYKARTKPKQSNLIALGSGLGFQLEALQKKLEFINIVLVEPEDDMLFHFLHYVDLDQLSQYCANNGGTFNILQPDSYQSFSNMMLTLAEHIGFSMFAEVSVYRHYETNLFDEILENFKSLRNGWVSAWGFIDDELLGMIHTIENAKSHDFVTETVSSDANSPSDEKTFIIVGNGPSLDKNIELLKTNQDKFIIVSCGTALAALLRSGIKPDFHAEMERSNFTPIVQNKWFTPNFCNNTTLLALNTVSPKITNLFAHCLMFAKSNDVGTHILEKAGEQPLKPLFHCNPTVTNFAVSAVLAIGASRIVLLGCDFGFRENTKHHAKQSDYFEDGSRLANIQPNTEMQTVDNHGKALSTTRILNIARQNMERLVDKSRQLQFLNCSDGAKIKGFKWLSFEQVIHQCGNNSKETCFSISMANLKLNKTTLAQVVLHYANALKHLISLMKQGFQEHHIHKLFNQIAEYLKQTQYEQRADIFLSGSTKYVAVCAAGHLSKIAPNKKQEYCDFALTEIINMYERAIQKLITLTKE